MQLKEAKFDSEFETLRVTQEGLEHGICRALSDGCLIEKEGLIALTLKGVARMNDYFGYKRGGGG